MNDAAIACFVTFYLRIFLTMTITATVTALMMATCLKNADAVHFSDGCDILNSYEAEGVSGDLRLPDAWVSRASAHSRSTCSLY